MQKKLWIPAVMLLASCIFLAGRSLGSADSLPATPQIIRRVALTNQTAPIPATTLFTPSHTGLYRVTAYLTTTAPVPNLNVWAYGLSWADDAGTESASLLYAYMQSPPPNAYGVDAAGSPSKTTMIEAVAGQPVSYQISGDGTQGSAAYSLYIIVERLAP